MPSFEKIKQRPAKAIKNGNFITWPGIDNLSLGNHLPPSIITAKGHLNQESKNIQSTKIKDATIDSDFLPSSSEPNHKTFDACATIIPFASRGTGYHDLTGCFPHTSS
jgi:hypothetical protein